METTGDESSKKEKAALYWYSQGYREKALHRKVQETMEEGEIVSEDYITCASGVCDQRRYDQEVLRSFQDQKFLFESWVTTIL